MFSQDRLAAAGATAASVVDDVPPRPPRVRWLLLPSTARSEKASDDGCRGTGSSGPGIGTRAVKETCMLRSAASFTVCGGISHRSGHKKELYI